MPHMEWLESLSLEEARQRVFAMCDTLPPKYGLLLRRAAELAAQVTPAGWRQVLMLTMAAAALPDREKEHLPVLVAAAVRTLTHGDARGMPRHMTVTVMRMSPPSKALGSTRLSATLLMPPEVPDPAVYPLMVKLHGDKP